MPQTTDSTHGRRVTPNLLLGQPAPTAADQVWVGDITYLPRQSGGWFYLAVWLDRCTRRVVGWHVRTTMPAELVSEALRRALVTRRPAAGLIVHSDQGSQYTADDFQQLLTRHGALASMSRKGNRYDNAQPNPFGVDSKRTTCPWRLDQSGNGAPRTSRLHRLLQPHPPAFGPPLLLPQRLRKSTPNHVPTLSGLTRPPQQGGGIRR